MKKKILFVLCLLTGLMFINAGLNKFFNYMPVPKDLPGTAIKLFTAMMEIKWLMPLIAVAEIIGGALIITNRYRALGALILFPVMLGILANHLTMMMQGFPVSLALFAVLLWAMYDNREKFLPLVK